MDVCLIYKSACVGSELVQMTSYTAYRILDVWVPSFAVGFIFVFLFLFVIFKVVMKLRRRKQKLVNRWFFEILRLAFRDLKRDKYGRNSIYGHEIGQVSFALVVIISVPVLVGACFITFWNIYMVEEQIGSECNTHYDCFPIENGNRLQENPVNNCSSWPPDTHYRCYRLVYNYVQGVSATGGILFFASVMLKIYTVTLVAPYNLQNVCWKWICYGLVIISGSTITILFILLHMSISHTQDTVFRTATYKIQFVIYSFLLFVVFIFTGPLLIYGIECESLQKIREEDDDENDFANTV